MLWSLVKVLVFVAIVAGLAWGATLLMETGPGVQLIVGSVEFNLGPLQAVLVGLVAIAAVWAVLKLAGLIVAFLRFLNGDETAFSRYFDRNRERRGYAAIEQCLGALAAGDSKQAMALAAKAERALHKPEVTNLLVAQAAELAGDRRKAEAAYKQMLGNERTRFVGIRGIMEQKLAAGDTDTALELAKKALTLRPRSDDVADRLLQLQAEKHDWAGARKTLGTKLKSGRIPRDLHRRRDAVLALGQAKDVIAEGNTIEAREAAIQANALSPDMVPAAVMAARAYIEQDKPRYAARVIKKAWEAQPHPELATAFSEIAKGESPRDRIKRFEPLLRLRPGDPETKMLRAELLIAAEDFPAARRAMGDLATADPTTRSLAIMAAIERGEGSDDAVVRGWLARAVTAPRGPQWVCDKCSAIAGEWGPICANCGGFDTLSWRSPPAADTASATGAEMLPLIVGAPEAPVDAGAGESDAEVVDVTPEPAESRAS